MEIYQPGLRAACKEKFMKVDFPLNAKEMTLRVNLSQKFFRFSRIFQSKVLQQAEIQNTKMYDQLKEKISAKFNEMKNGW